MQKKNHVDFMHLLRKMIYLPISAQRNGKMFLVAQGLDVSILEKNWNFCRFVFIRSFLSSTFRVHKFRTTKILTKPKFPEMTRNFRNK